MSEMKKVQVDEIMSSPVRSVSADATLREAAQSLLDWGFSGAPVLDEGGGVVGVLSLKDIARYAKWHLDAEAASEEGKQEREELAELNARERGLRALMHLDRLEGATVRQVMTSRVASVRTGTPLTEATAILLEGPIHRLLVTNSRGKPVGVVSTMDVVRFFHEQLVRS